MNLILNLVDKYALLGEDDLDGLAAIALQGILALDASAEADLDRALFAGQQIDASSRRGAQRVLDILASHGAIEQKSAAGDFDGVDLSFHAGPLIDLLRRMPHRDPATGLSS